MPTLVKNFHGISWCGFLILWCLAFLSTGLAYLQFPPACAVGRLTTLPGTSSRVLNTLLNCPIWICGDDLERRRHFCRIGRVLNKRHRRGHHPSLSQPSDDWREGYDDHNDDDEILELIVMKFNGYLI